MAYSTYPYQDSWSMTAGYQPSSSSSTWEWDGRRDGYQHAPRRLQHGYSAEAGHYTYDVGSLREDDPYRLPPRSSAARRSVLIEDSHRQGEKPSSKRRDDKEKTNSGRSSKSASGSARTSGSSRSSSSRSSTVLETTKSRSSHPALPRTPTIERLATPELAPLNAGLRFCTCGCSDAYHEEEERYRQGREKMDGQLQYAVRHMARH